MREAEAEQRQRLIDPIDEEEQAELEIASRRARMREADREQDQSRGKDDAPAQLLRGNSAPRPHAQRK